MSFISKNLARWKTIWTAISGGNQSAGGSIRGNATGSGASSHVFQNYRYDISQTPLRPVRGSLEYSRDLLEIMEWSFEARVALSFLSRDPFLERFGRIGSWKVGETLDDSPVNEIILKRGMELRSRKYNNRYILGGLRLRRAAKEAIGGGDSFLQMCIEKEGITKGRYSISRTMYMPPFSMFVEEDEYGEPAGYREQLTDGEDILFNGFDALKILHFSYEQERLYGESALFQCIPTWRQIKRTRPATEKAVMQAGVAPWVHKMGEETTEDQMQRYIAKHEADRNNGFQSDIYIQHDFDFGKPNANVDGVAEAIEYEQRLNRRMIPLGLPAYFFPGLSENQRGAKQISGQPAMLYARTVSTVRAMLGEKIKTALDIELALEYGMDFLLQNPYEIVWPAWDVLPPAQRSVNGEELGVKDEAADEDDSKDDKDSSNNRRLRAV